MSFERNDKYWGAPVLLRRMRFQVTPEAAARLAALRAGQVHVVEAVPPLDAGVLGREPNVKVVSSVQKLACRLNLNARGRGQYESGGKDGLFTDPRLRMALNLAINRSLTPTTRRRRARCSPRPDGKSPAADGSTSRARRSRSSSSIRRSTTARASTR
jgi:ABC-type oligopeptide transport system substrate-binding subunit